MCILQDMRYKYDLSLKSYFYLTHNYDKQFNSFITLSENMLIPRKIKILCEYLILCRQEVEWQDVVVDSGCTGHFITA